MFFYSKWCALSLPTRIKIAEIFGIPKKGSTEVFNNTIKSDGYEIKDIESKLTMSALQILLATDMDDLSVLFDIMVQKVETGEVLAFSGGSIDGPIVPQIPLAQATEEPEPVVAPEEEKTEEPELEPEPEPKKAVKKIIKKKK